jgi:glycosyltransferase involved in cell wall biosynthesis
MKIAIFSDIFYPQLSGISDSILETGKELARRGHQVIYFVPSYSKKDHSHFDKKDEISDFDKNIHPNISVIRIPSINYPLMFQTRIFSPINFRLLALKKFKPDVLHTQSYFSAGIMALIASRIFKKPLIGTNHTVFSEFFQFSPIHSRLVKSIYLKFAYWYYSHCDFLTAPSAWVISDMQSHEKTIKKIPSQVISNPISEEFYVMNNQQKEEAKLKFKTNDYTLIYAGRISPEKNIETIIKAIALVKKEIPEVNLLIAGIGKKSYVNRLKELIFDLNIENRIQFLKLLSHQDLARAYNASKIFIIMSTSETQSMVLMQATACGLPIIAANSKALPEYVKNDFGVLVPAKDQNKLATEIINLLKNPELEAKMSKKAAIFSQEFRTAKIADLWENLYSKVIEKYNKYYGQKPNN